MTWPTVVGLVSSGIGMLVVLLATIRWAVRLPKRVIAAITAELKPIHFEVSANGGSGSLKDTVIELQADTTRRFTRVENHLRRQDRKIANLQADMEAMK